MAKLITQCPSCGNSTLEFSKIHCGDCDTTFEGKFELHALLCLSESELDFILNFVKCSGSLKEMGAHQKVSYPTLRNRLNELIEHIERLSDDSEQSKQDILQMLEDGKITATKAAAMLQKK